MAKADQIKALVRSHAEGDNTRFYAVAMQVAAQAARNGHTQVAKDLRDLVDQAKEKERSSPSSRPVPLTQPRGELAGLLNATYPTARLSGMALDEAMREKLSRVVREQRQRAQLQAHGFSPLRKLLLIGPPGTGKSLTASALAGELKLPLFNVRLDAVISKFMGETAAKLRLIFDAMVETRGVYLFDEFDSLGSQRGLSHDVGEIRRVLNSFLQFIEQDDSESIIIGATNHVELLDHALFRRFDAVFEYTLPDEDVARRVMAGRLALLDTQEVDWSKVVSASSGLSHGEITRACEQAAKDALLEGSEALVTEGLVAALEERQRMKR